MPYGRAGFYIAYTSLPAYQIRKPFIASKEVYKLRGIFPGFDEHKRFFSGAVSPSGAGDGRPAADSENPLCRHRTASPWGSR
jgi:hypothetical protein